MIPTGEHPPTSPVRIVIADDHPVVRIGVRNVLTAHAGFTVVGEAEDGAAALRQTIAHRPDILLLDVQMPSSPGLASLREIASASPQTRVVILTGSLAAAQVSEAFQSGARGVVLKSAMTEQIAAALLAVMDGAYWENGRRVSTVEEVFAELKIQAAEKVRGQANLTRREREVVGLIVKGFSNRDIARQFNLSEETVKRHLSNIFEKIGISTRLELAIHAIAHNLVPDTEPPPKPPLTPGPSKPLSGTRI